MTGELGMWGIYDPIGISRSRSLMFHACGLGFRPQRDLDMCVSSIGFGLERMYR